MAAGGVVKAPQRVGFFRVEVRVREALVENRVHLRRVYQSAAHRAKEPPVIPAQNCRAGTHQGVRSLALAVWAPPGWPVESCGLHYRVRETRLWSSHRCEPTSLEEASS